MLQGIKRNVLRHKSICTENDPMIFYKNSDEHWFQQASTKNGTIESFAHSFTIKCNLRFLVFMVNFYGVSYGPVNGLVLWMRRQSTSGAAFFAWFYPLGSCWPAVESPIKEDAGDHINHIGILGRTVWKYAELIRKKVKRKHDSSKISKASRPWNKAGSLVMDRKELEQRMVWVNESSRAAPLDICL